MKETIKLLIGGVAGFYIGYYTMRYKLLKAIVDDMYNLNKNKKKEKEES